MLLRTSEHISQMKMSTLYMKEGILRLKVKAKENDITPAR